MRPTPTIKSRRYIAAGALAGLLLFLILQLAVLFAVSNTLARLVFSAFPPEIGAPETRGLLAAGPFLLVCIALGASLGFVVFKIVATIKTRRSSP